MKKKSKTKTVPIDPELQSQQESSPVLNHLYQIGMALTRENYLGLAYMGHPPAEIDPETEASFPEVVRRKPRARRKGRG